MGKDLLVKTYNHPLRAWRILDRRDKSLRRWFSAEYPLLEAELASQKPSLTPFSLDWCHALLGRG